MPNILIIDDDAHINDIVCRALQAEGYTVSQAYSGTEALMVLATADQGYSRDRSERKSQCDR